MNIQRRFFADLLIVAVIALIAGLTVRFTGAPEWIGLVIGVAATGLAVQDVLRAGYAGRPLWRWRWLDEPPAPRAD